MKKIALKFEKFGSKIVIALALLLPLAFVPSATVGFDTIKLAFVTLAVLFIAVAHIVYSYSRGTISMPSGPLVKILGVLMLVALISGIMSPVPWKSIVGAGFEMGTTITLLAFIALALCVATVVRKTSEQVYVVAALSTGVALSTFYSLVRFIFGADFISFGYFTSLTQSPLGTMSNTAITIALVTVMILYVVQVVTGRGIKVFLGILSTLSFLYLIAANVYSAWVILLVGSLMVIGVRYIRMANEAGIISRSINSVTLGTVLAVILAITGIIFPTLSARFIAQRINLVENTIRPSWQASVDLLAQSIKVRPFTGIGPNRLGVLYVATRPASVNSTVGANIDFDSAVSYVFTLITTHGLVMLIASSIFVVYTLRSAVQILRMRSESVKHHVQTAATLGATLGIGSLLFVNPTPVLLGMLAILGGLVIAIQEDSLVEIKLVRDNGKLHYVNFVATAIVGLVVVVGIVVHVQFLRAHIKLGKALVSAGKGDIDAALTYGATAREINFIADVYPRTLAEIYAFATNALIQNVAASLQSSKIDEQTLEKFRVLLSNGSALAAEAVQKDQTNYQNTVAEIRIAEAGILLGAQNAYEVATQGYDRALALNPSSAVLYLDRALMEVSRQDYEKAEVQATNALYLKPDYVDAVMVLARIKIAQNKTREAVSFVEQAAQAMPQNSRMAFELGVLKYSLKNYSGALAAFEQAQTLLPNDATVSYSRALALAQLGRRTDAIALLVPLADAYPQNTDITTVLENLRSGRSPFGTVNSTVPENDKVDAKSKTR